MSTSRLWFFATLCIVALACLRPQSEASKETDGLRQAMALSTLPTSNFICSGTGEDIGCMCIKGWSDPRWDCGGMDEKCRVITGRDKDCTWGVCGCSTKQLTQQSSSGGDSDHGPGELLEATSQERALQLSWEEDVRTMTKIIDFPVLNYTCMGNARGMGCWCVQGSKQPALDCSGMDQACGLLVGKDRECRDGLCECKNVIQ